MTSTRSARALRGALAAIASTFVALLSHVAGGGEVPGLLGILVPLVLATAVCVPLAGRRLSILRVSASVIASQMLFHVLFVLGSAGNTSAASATGGVGHEGHGGHGSAAAPLLLATPASGPSAGVPAHAHAGMWAAHAAAAAVTILAIYQGERVVRRLRTLAVALVRVLLPVVSTIPVPFLAAAPADIETVSLPRSLSVYPSTRSHRGPPAVSFPSLPLAT
ncbi:hypothetical protein ALI44B_02255 [Leifsonia sp. ALI-44-B]|jgi:hypothetical protein|uniref:hypothetical protein n=1 Tax=Leifsonia sp. ALI-44-B TaxID=1933776 RepID=UPI00097CBD20|nr:hypothetical protein [Leifsonia sp. ALI-44-B]ONI63545.1 hypothetical protein ALI44B_02255 [Leifsonia sp. ALI-44-B]